MTSGPEGQKHKKDSPCGGSRVQNGIGGRGCFVSWGKVRCDWNEGSMSARRRPAGRPGEPASDLQGNNRLPGLHTETGESRRHLRKEDTLELDDEGQTQVAGSWEERGPTSLPGLASWVFQGPWRRSEGLQGLCRGHGGLALLLFSS